MTVNIKWVSQEVHGNYPPHFGKGPYSYKFTDTEELIIQRCHEKIAEKEAKEKLTHHERAYKHIISGEEPDRWLISIIAWRSVAGYILSSFAPESPVISSIDFLFHPNLDFVTQFLWNVRFPSDVFCPSSPTFGEEALTSKFKLLEPSTILASEPFIKTEEDGLWLLDNMPDPALNTLWPAYLWELKQGTKWFPELIVVGCCCAGPVVAASYARGVTKFLIEIRKKPEMAELTLKVATKYIKYKLDRVMNILRGPPKLDVKEFDILFLSDSVDYFRADQFERTFSLHYGDIVPYCARRGWPLLLWPGAPPNHMDLLCACLKENLGGGVGGGSEHPPVEIGWEIVRKKYGLLGGMNANEKTLLNGPLDAIKNEMLRMKKLAAQDKDKGLHIVVNPFAVTDPKTPLSHLDYAIKLAYEFGKYPATM